MAGINFGSEVTKAGSFEIVTDEEETREKDGPSCPDCGSRNIGSNGRLRWSCQDCGRSFGKFKHARSKPDYLSRPPCPYCGAFKSNSHSSVGHRYVCGNCGRYFTCPEKD